MTSAVLVDPDDGWEARLQRNAKGNRTANLANAVTILGHDPAWRTPDGHRIAFDAFADRLSVVAPPPWHDDDAPRGALVAAVDSPDGERVRLAPPVPTTERPRQWADVDTGRLQAWFSRGWGLEVSGLVAYEAARIVAERWPVHPVRAYLSRLRWDGTLRLGSWLATYLGAAATPYTAGVGRWWMISAVARVMQPGCKADHVVILEGVQGARKSSALRALVGPDWFADTPIDLNSKDKFVVLRGRWVVELAELDSLSRAEASSAKAFFSSPDDTYRPPYGRESVTIPRQCVFAGTVNHGQYLRDETGARRYWPVVTGATGPIDLDAIREDRDQIWAEAVEAFRGGAAWWPETADDQAAAREEQEQRYSGDEWEAKVAAYVESYRGSPAGVTVGDVLSACLDIPADKWTLPDQRRVAGCLTRLGFRRVQRRVAGGRVWSYVAERAAPTTVEAAQTSPVSPVQPEENGELW